MGTHLRAAASSAITAVAASPQRVLPPTAATGLGSPASQRLLHSQEAAALKLGASAPNMWNTSRPPRSCPWIP